MGTSLGIGAAPFLAPLLVFRYHLPLGQALGTALAIGFLASASCTATFFQGYRAAFRPIQPLVWAGITGSLLSSLLLPPMTLARFPYLLAILLIASATYALLNRAWALSSFAQGPEAPLSRAWASRATSSAWQSRAIVTALFAGGVARSLGVGAGLVFIPFLAIESGVPWPVALVAAQAADVPVAFSSSLLFLHHGQLNFPLAVYVGAGSMVGAQLGVRVVTQCSPAVWGLAYFLTCLGLGAFLLALG